MVHNLSKIVKASHRLLMKIRQAQTHPVLGMATKFNSGEDFSNGVTRVQADALFSTDVARFESAVNLAINVPLSQSQFDSLVSFSYNVGVSAFSGSTLVRTLNSGNFAGAPAQMNRWVNYLEV